MSRELPITSSHREATGHGPVVLLALLLLRSGRSLIVLLAKHPKTALVASGLVLYGLLAIDYALFYRQLGVEPSEVGLSYSETLIESAAAALALAAAVGVIGLLLVAVLALLLFAAIPALGALGRTCLVYLGSANGTAIFYRRADRKVVRMPVGVATLLGVERC